MEMVRRTNMMFLLSQKTYQLSMVDLTQVLAAIVPGLIYAISGLAEASKKGEKLQASQFIKTIIIWFLTGAGMLYGVDPKDLSQLFGGVAFSSFLSYGIDKLLNVWWKKVPT